ncbi:hypothetical protein N9R87_02420 [Flavobacteriaceae bacterium]|nr:hypothetical protein [Flavobacteriaceae bacterium]
MKKLLLASALFIFACSFGQTFEITDGQSMCMIGKGQGQDATINPYAEKEYSFVVIENIGSEDFIIRIQNIEKLQRTLLSKPGERFKIKLLKGSELYLDSTTINTCVAQILYTEE